MVSRLTCSTRGLSQRIATNRKMILPAIERYSGYIPTCVTLKDFIKFGKWLHVVLCLVLFSLLLILLLPVALLAWIVHCCDDSVDGDSADGSLLSMLLIFCFVTFV